MNGEYSRSTHGIPSTGNDRERSPQPLCKIVNQHGQKTGYSTERVRLDELDVNSLLNQDDDEAIVRTHGERESGASDWNDREYAASRTNDESARSVVSGSGQRSPLSHDDGSVYGCVVGAGKMSVQNIGYADAGDSDASPSDLLSSTSIVTVS